MRLNRLFLIFMLVFSGSLCGGVHEGAAQTRPQAAYFEALYDVPVMQGMKEVKDEALLFDKPDGKIASALAVADALSPMQVRAFYDRALPQLGWIKNKDNQYVRGGEQLVLAVSQKDGLTYARFTLSPLRNGR